MTYTVSSGTLNSTIPYHTYWNQPCGMKPISEIVVMRWHWKSAGHCGVNIVRIEISVISDGTKLAMIDTTASVFGLAYYHQCFDAIGWASGRALGP